MAISTLFTPIAQCQITVLGHHPFDQVMAAFWAQNRNASNTVQGLNAQHGTNKWLNGILPDLIFDKGLGGTFTATNSFLLRQYDADGATYQNFTLNYTNGIAADTNTIVRSGFPETLRYKVLNDVRFQSNSANLSGVLLAKGADYATVINGISGTNVYVFPGGTWTFKEGVLTSATGSTNMTGLGISSINGLTTSTQVFATGTSGTDFTISSSSDTHTFNIPTASASARGLLSGSDWTTFNAKLSGTLTSPFVPYATGASTVADSSLYRIAANQFGLGSSDLFLSGSSAQGNVSLGHEALESAGGGTTDHTALGARSLQNNTSGDANTGVGRDTLKANTTGSQNTALGAFALTLDPDGENNTALGYGALILSTNVDNTVAVGALALQSLRNGNEGVAIGVDAGTGLVTANNFVVIGEDATGPDGGTNFVAIGANAAASTNAQMVLGSGITDYRLRDVWYRMPSSQGGASTVLENDGNGNLSWATVTSTTINPSDNYIPVRSSSTTFADSGLYRVGVTNVALDGQLIFGTGTTNVVYRSGTDLLYTNGTTGTLLYKVINGNAVSSGFGTSSAGNAIVLAASSKNVHVAPNNAASGGVLFTTGTIQPVTDRELALGGILARFKNSVSQIFSSTTSAQNNGAGEDNLISTTLSGNTLTVNTDYLHIRAAGTFAANGNNKTVKAYFGSTQIFSTGALAFNGGDWVLTGEVFRTGAATQKANVTWSCSNTTLSSSAALSSPAETLSGAITVKLTGEATDTGDIVNETMTILFYPSP